MTLIGCSENTAVGQGELDILEGHGGYLIGVPSRIGVYDGILADQGIGGGYGSVLYLDGRGINMVLSRQIVCEVVCVQEEHITACGGRLEGKTGTSEKLIDVNGDGVDDYIASFCGFAPANNPQYAALVFFDAPLGGNYYGSAVAAPVFANIMSEVLPYLDVVAQYTEEEMSNIDTAAGSYTGMSTEDAMKAAEKDGFIVNIKGEGTTVISQNPSAGAVIPTGGTIVLYTDQTASADKVAVPNFVGYSVTDCNYIAAQYGLNVSVTGAAASSESVAIAQSVAEGEQVSPGTVITVTFSTGGIND